MKTTLLALLAFAFTAPAFAENSPCANMAKSAAIRAYKAETGTIQGSEGIQYEALLVGVRGNNYNYLVSISDNNEDGETWEVDYSVVVQSAGACRVLSTKKVATR